MSIVCPDRLNPKLSQTLYKVTTNNALLPLSCKILIKCPVIITYPIHSGYLRIHHLYTCTCILTVFVCLQIYMYIFFKHYWGKHKIIKFSYYPPPPPTHTHTHTQIIYGFWRSLFLYRTPIIWSSLMRFIFNVLYYYMLSTRNDPIIYICTYKCGTGTGCSN